ncbi:MAG: hypothetical protein MMC33_005327 [Icmadophila ericetorum]|nr:hypothetical protein [Icmadophila ericetorum]
MLRHTHLIARRSALRHASTTSKATEAASNTASKAKETASNATSKASEGLSRVTSSAGPAISGAAQRVGGAISSIGGRTGRLISFVQSLIPPTIYYSRVGLELSRMVFHGQKMYPPSPSAFQGYITAFTSAIRNPRSLFNSTAQASSMSPEKMLGSIRNLNSAQLLTGGVAVAEVLGFFTVGEMIGRMKLVGYHGDVHHHETATPHDGAH